MELFEFIGGIILLVIAVLYMFKVEITTDPFMIKAHAWKAGLGWILVVAGIYFITEQVKDSTIEKEKEKTEIKK
jgi:small neutral amino acid transporter SnatA (MarC family)